MNNNEHIFQNLPDWVKVGFKTYIPSFNNYPIQNSDQMKFRKRKIFDICSHFALCDSYAFAEFMEERNNNDIFGYWPNTLSLFITPRLLDIYPVENITNFGYCTTCISYRGYNKISKTMIDFFHEDATQYQKHRKPYESKILKRNKVLALYGKCSHIRYPHIPPQYEHKEESLNRVHPFFRCVAWNPSVLYKQIIFSRIIKYLNEYDHIYSNEDYGSDIEYINIFEYFADKYKSAKKPGYSKESAYMFFMNIYQDYKKIFDREKKEMYKIKKELYEDEDEEKEIHYFDKERLVDF